MIQILINQLDFLFFLKTSNLKRSKDLFDNIEKSKQVTLAKFIYALGIRHIGESNAKILAKEFLSAQRFFHSMLKLAQGDREIFDLLDNLEGIGNKILIDIKDARINVPKME